MAVAGRLLPFQQETPLKPIQMCTVVAATLMAATFAVAQPSASPSASQAGSSGAAMSTGSSQMHHTMTDGMQKMKAMQPTGDTDRDFAQMMKMHHQQAVEMAQAQVQHGKSPELKAMARKIIKDQQREIAQFDRWLSGRQ